MLLLIPGPVATHPDVRAAASQDIAPWDAEIRAAQIALLDRLRALSGASRETHIALPLSGAGHFMIEAAIRSFVPPEGGLLIPACGQYADRMTRLARSTGRRTVVLPAPLDRPLDPAALEAALAADPGLSHVGLVQSETSTGIVHDVAALGAVARRLGRRVILDAVSAFGALPMDLARQPEVDALIFTANKCLEGLPGFAIGICRLDALAAGRGRAASWSLDLADVYANGLEHGFGASRFTPPAQAMAALAVALDRLEAEGGPPARLRRYEANMAALRQGVEAAGLRPFLPADLQGPIVMNVHAPARADWDLQRFVDALKARGVLISNFRNTEEPGFRVGAIGAIGTADIARATQAMAEVLAER